MSYKAALPRIFHQEEVCALYRGSTFAFLEPPGRHSGQTTIGTHRQGALGSETLPACLVGNGLAQGS